MGGRPRPSRSPPTWRTGPSSADSSPLDRFSEGEGGLDQGGMRERLREVAKVFSRRRIHLFGVQAEVGARSAQGLEQLARLVETTHAGQSQNEPERTGEEGALVPLEPVAPRRIAVEERASR